MKCPRCVQKIHRAAVACPHCGFTLADADAQFGESEVRLRCFADTAGLLRSDQKGRVESAMEDFSKRFPQLFIAIYTGKLGEMAHLRQFGFWLLNRAIFEDLPAGKSNASGILLTIDPESKAAGMTFGYLLDPYFEEVDTFDCLSRAHSHWLEGHYADGMVKAIEQLEVSLRKRNRLARRYPTRFERKVQPPQVGDLARRIRSGHHPEAEIEPSDFEEGPR